METAKEVQLPRYAPHRLIARRIARVTSSRLREWSRQGYVRAAKLGNSKQAACLFCVADVENVLERLAGGYTPRRRRRIADHGTRVETDVDTDGLGQEPENSNTEGNV